MKYKILYILLFAAIQTFAQNKVNYEYDLLNRLTKVTYSNGVSISYTYDALGNRISKIVKGSNVTTYTITIGVTPAGSGSVTGGGKYSNGTTVELNAIANAGYEFLKWSDGVTDNPRTITVTADVQLTAQFKEIKGTLAGDVNGDGKVDNLDLDILVNAYLENATVTEVTDIDGDGKLTIADITKLISMLPKNGSDDITDGLVAYYPFNGNANDESGNGNDGTPTYNVTLTQGVKGDENGAYLFGGYDKPGHIYVKNSESLQFTNGCTFSAYVKPMSWASMDGWGSRIESGGVQCIMAKEHDRRGVTFEMAGSDEKCRIWMGSMDEQPWAELSSKDRMQGNYLNKWTHIAFVYGSSFAQLYIDGTLVDEKESSPDFTRMNMMNLYIGKFSDSWYPFNGLIDEIRIYNRALTSDEISTLAQYHERMDGSLEGGGGGGSESDVHVITPDE